MKKTILFTSLLASAVALSAITFSGKNRVNQVKASEELSLSAEGDAFK